MTSRAHGRSSNAKDVTASLSLKIAPADDNKRNVDVDEFLSTAERWVGALKVFAEEQGKQVKWEIVGLRKSSAFIQVQPVAVRTGKPASSLVHKWEQGLSRIRKTGRPVPQFTPASLIALREFVTRVPNDAVVYVGNSTRRLLKLDAEIQRRVVEAAQSLPEAKNEYTTQGSIRGRLAILNSWDPAERSFRLQLPLAPTKPVVCTYVDASLVEQLGESFEGTVEITGKLKYKRGETWPHVADVEHIRVVSRTPTVSLEDLVGLVRLPPNQDSVSYVRSLRDAE